MSRCSFFIYIILLGLCNFLCHCETSNKVIIRQGGDDLKLTCKVAKGVIYWFKDGEGLNPSSSSDGSGDSISTITRNNLTMKDAGMYQCTDKALTTHNFSVSILTVSGKSQELVANASEAVLECSVENEELEVIEMRWRRGNDLINETDKYLTITNGSSSSLIISNPDENDVGPYVCEVSIEHAENKFEKIVGLNNGPHVKKIVDLRNKVEGETAFIVCNVTGYPVPRVTWFKLLEDETQMQVITYDERVSTEAVEGVADAKLIIRDLKIKTDRGDYTCVATNYLDSFNATVTLKVKDKLAAVWPFLGICAEVIILCSIIFIFEKRRNRRMEEEEGDAVKQDLMKKSNGTSQDVRQRNTVTKA
ncbi:basigin-like [Watersipora subatra]|uniref:basigin-like n=1 Tax=Watersipora subatra TaxID=2589382 RepID=UPI00355B2191